MSCKSAVQPELIHTIDSAQTPRAAREGYERLEAVAIIFIGVVPSKEE
jgi:hypothetical protein